MAKTPAVVFLDFRLFVVFSEAQTKFTSTVSLLETLTFLLRLTIDLFSPSPPSSVFVLFLKTFSNCAVQKNVKSFSALSHLCVCILAFLTFVFCHVRHWIIWCINPAKYLKVSFSLVH